MKTADHFWTDPSADELVQRHRIHSSHCRQDSPTKRPALCVSVAGQLLGCSSPECWEQGLWRLGDQHGAASGGLCPSRAPCVSKKQRQLKSALFIANKAHSWGFSKYRIELGQSQESF